MRLLGIHIINIGKTWEKLVFAARIIAAIENPNDVCVISARPYGHRAVLKFAANTGAQAIAGRFTPGSFTNYITRSFKEPRLIIVTDPRVDHQAIREASYVNIPVIAFCDTDAPLKFVDVAIPINNKSRHSVGLAWWLLAREVLRLRGTIPRTPDGWNVMVDMFFYRDPEEVEKQQQEEAAAKAAAAAGEQAEAPITDWDVTSAPQAGGINPGLVAGEGGYSLLVCCLYGANGIDSKVASTGLRSPLLLVPLTGQQSQLLLDGVRSLLVPAVGIKHLWGCYLSAVATTGRCLAMLCCTPEPMSTLTCPSSRLFIDAKLCTAYDQHDMLFTRSFPFDRLKCPGSSSVPPTCYISRPENRSGVCGDIVFR